MKVAAYQILVNHIIVWGTNSAKEAYELYDSLILHDENFRVELLRRYDSPRTFYALATHKGRKSMLLTEEQ